MYFRFCVNEELHFAAYGCDSGLPEVKAKTPLNFLEHWTAEKGQLMMGSVSF